MKTFRFEDCSRKNYYCEPHHCERCDHGPKPDLPQVSPVQRLPNPDGMASTETVFDAAHGVVVMLRELYDQDKNVRLAVGIARLENALERESEAH